MSPRRRCWGTREKELQFGVAPKSALYEGAILLLNDRSGNGGRRENRTLINRLKGGSLSFQLYARSGARPRTRTETVARFERAASANWASRAAVTAGFEPAFNPLRRRMPDPSGRDQNWRARKESNLQPPPSQSGARPSSCVRMGAHRRIKLRIAAFEAPRPSQRVGQEIGAACRSRTEPLPLERRGASPEA